MKSMRYAMPQVVAERLLLDLVEGSAHRTNLGHNLDAVAVFLYHARHAADLALNATKARELGFFQFFIHTLNYTPVAYRYQA